MKVLFNSCTTVVRRRETTHCTIPPHMYMNIELTSKELKHAHAQQQKPAYSIAEFIKENGSLKCVNEPLELGAT